MISDLDKLPPREKATWRRVAVPRWAEAATVMLVLAAVVLVAFSLRALNLAHWDNRQGLHPDERFIQYVVYFSRLPQSVYEYLDSSISPLNPRNHTEWSREFFYGTLPTSLTRAVVDLSDRTAPEEIVVVGRALSTFFDLAACVALFFLGRLCFNRGVGLLAAALYAVAVMPIQQSHFFTNDNFGVAFTTLALIAVVRLSLFGRWRDAVWAGVWTSAAAASKINLAAVSLLVVLALVQFSLRGRHRSQRLGGTPAARAVRSRLLRAAQLLMLSGFTTVVCFRVFQPDAFMGPQLWDLRLDPRFTHDMRLVRVMVNGTVDMPPSHQWAGRAPYLFPLWNMIIWGMGIPLGIAAWGGFVWAGLQLLRRGRSAGGRFQQAYLLPWLWVALYFAWQGGGFNPSMRYFLPIYPPLMLFAAWGCLELGRWLRVHWEKGRPWRLHSVRIALWVVPAAVVLSTTVAWAWAFTRIYTRPHTRVVAGQWMLDNAPRGSWLTWELWDDPLPYTNGGSSCDPFCLIVTTPFAEDEPAKFFGSETAATAPNPLEAVQEPEGLINQLARADYVVLSSARVYESVQRLPHRYPATLRYYRALFDGSLGFDLVADFSSFPTLFGIAIPDLQAEEAFTVYDHPRVLIFQRTDRFTVDRAREILTDGVVWSEIYRISARETSEAPDALRLTARLWQLLQIDGDGMSAFALGSARASLGAQILAWLIVTELLGLAVFGMLWHFGVPLPDRGILSARFCGLLLFGFPPALLAASGLVPVTRPLLLAWFAVLLSGGLVALLAHRAVVWHFVRRHRTQFLVCQSLVVGVYALALAIRWLAPAAFPAPTGFGLAQWAAMLRSPVLPPPDPLFAGGELVVPYATLVPLASTARLLALPPDLALNLALATTLTLLVSLVWVVAASPMPGREPRPMSSISAGYALPWLAVLLLLAPGAPVHELRSLAPIGMLAAGSLPALAGLAVAAGALVLVRGIRITEGSRRRVEWRRWIGPGIALALAAALLGLVRAQDRWVFLALIGPSMLVLWRSLDRAGTRRGRVMLVLLAGTLVLAQPFVVAFQLLAAPGALLSTQRALASLALALSSILLCLSVVARFADRVLMSGVVVVVAGSMLASVMLGLPFVVPLVGLAGLLLWLVVEATIRKRGRVSALVVALVSALAGSVLIVPADLIRAGYLAGDPQFVFGAVLLLLVFAFARAAAYLVRFVRPRQPFVLVFATGLLVGTLLMSVTQTVLPRSRDAANDSTAPQSIGLHQAIQAIATDARGAATVAVAPTAAVSPLVEATGLPALLSAPQIGGAQRAILRPSYDAVVSGRARALADIYGPDAERAAEQLTRFAVRYVLVGPEEYGMYGSGAGAGLRQLAASGRIAEVYGGDGVFLYRNVAVPDVPPYVAEAVELPVPPLRPSLPSP